MIPVMVWYQLNPDYLEDGIQLSLDYARSSVSEDPGCRRFDVIQDQENPTRFAWCEIYDDEDAFEAHKQTEHFQESHKEEYKHFAVAGSMSLCKSLCSVDDAQWHSARPSAPESDAFHGGLYVIHAPVLVRRDMVDDFVEALRLDAEASVREEPGCLRFDIHQNLKNPEELYLYEVYVNKAAFDPTARHPTSRRGWRPSRTGTRTDSRWKTTPP
jgi:autoinducer 2-degrading protein